MGLEALLSTLERREPVTPAAPEEIVGVTRQPASALACTLVTSVTAGEHAGPEDAIVCRRWLIHYPSIDVQVCFSREITYAGVMAARPGSVAATPLLETFCRPATPAEHRELVRLLAAILPEDTEGQHEALRVALADVDDALVCFRQLAASP